jgi:membrane protease YdiL (CAAX protease family)
VFENVKPKWYIGISALVITIAFFIFGAVPLQLRLGMWGLAITELGLLAIALVPIFLFKWKLRDVMPIKKITLKQILALSLLFIATYIVANTISLTIMYLFPEYAQLGAEMAGFYATVPFVLSIIIMSVMPGVCEEVLHRGLIQHTLKDVKSPFAIMIIMAIIFGVFHLDIYRFLPTAVIGFVLTYIMIKTDNFLLPVIFHAVNNAVSVALSYGMSENQTASIQASSIGAFLVLSALSPLLFYMGAKLLSKEKPSRKSKYAALALTLILSVMGIGILAFSPTRVPITNFAFTEEVNNETPPRIFGNIIIEKEGIYDLSVSMSDKTITVITTVRVEHEDGEIIWEIGGAELFANRPTALRSGIYRVIFTFETQSEQIIPIDISFAIK